MKSSEPSNEAEMDTIDATTIAKVFFERVEISKGWQNKIYRNFKMF